jgi:hypothetical protein
MNDIILKNQVGIPQLLNKIKMLTLWVLKAKYPHFGFGYHNWWFSPFFLYWNWLRDFMCFGWLRVCSLVRLVLERASFR